MPILVPIRIKLKTPRLPIFVFAFQNAPRIFGMVGRFFIVKKHQGISCHGVLSGIFPHGQKGRFLFHKPVVCLNFNKVLSHGALESERHDVRRFPPGKIDQAFWEQCCKSQYGNNHQHLTQRGHVCETCPKPKKQLISSYY